MEIVNTLINKVPTPAKTKKRAYRSELRQKQAAATRDSILEAFGRLLGEPGRGDVTMAEVARSASVAPATLFRHFENRQALYDAYIEHGARQLRVAPNVAESIDDLPQHVHNLYAFYESHGDLVRATIKTPWLLALNEPGRVRRARRIKELVAARFARLDSASCNEAAAQLMLWVSAYTWSWFVDNFNLDTTRAADLAASSVQRVLEELAQKERASP